MRKIFLYVLLLSAMIAGCDTNRTASNKEDNKELAALFDKYYNERMALLPLEATQNGDSIHNDKLFADFTDSYRATLREFFNRYQNEVGKFKREDLNETDQLNYD